MKYLFILIILLLLVAGLFFLLNKSYVFKNKEIKENQMPSSPQKVAVDSPVIAKVMGKNIYLKDLDPDNSSKNHCKRNSEQSLEECYQQWREGALAGIIWEPLREDFGKNHEIYANDTDIDQFIFAMIKLSKNDLPPLPNNQTQPSFNLSGEFERNLGNESVQLWKFNKAIYEIYRGKVIFQQADPLEPVEGYRRFLEEHERKGDFKIFNEAYKTKFWEYYIRDQPFEIPPEDVDFSQPWWLQAINKTH